MLKHFVVLATVLAMSVAGPTASAQEHKSDRGAVVTTPSVPPQHRATLERAQQLTVQAGEMYRRRELTRAVELAEQAIALYESILGPNDIGIADALVVVARARSLRGEYAHSEPAFRRVIDILERTLGPQHPVIADPLGGLAKVYVYNGDYVRARALLSRAYRLAEQDRGPEDVHVASLLVDIAVVEQHLGRRDDARRLLERALSIYERGPQPELAASPLMHLATLAFDRGETESSRAMLRRALALAEKTYGESDPALVNILNNLAFQEHAAGDDATAAARYERALAIHGRGPVGDHPHIAGLLSNLSAVLWSLGKLAEAVSYQARANDMRERQLVRALALGSERDRQLLLHTLAGNADGALSLHTRGAPNDEAALTMAATVALRTKGRLLEAASGSLGSLRQHLGPEQRKLLDRIADVRGRLARLTLAGPTRTSPEEHERTSSRLRNEATDLERTLATNSEAYRVRTTPVTLEAVQAAVPEGAALIELVRYKPYQPRAQTRAERWLPERYVAYVIGRTGSPGWADLGDAAAIDTLAKGLRQALRDVASDPRAAARQLHQRVMEPLETLIGTRTQLIIAPDGELALIPFEALIDDSNRYLIEGHSLSYLTTGRDLVGMNQRTAASSPPFIIADPDFGAAPATPADAQGALGKARFEPLPGTRLEGQQLAEVLSKASLVRGDEASEAALKRIRGPELLHIATHGFFLSAEAANEGRAATGDLDPSRALVLMDAPKPWANLRPLLRSGLALAGANTRKHGVDDGILTALEATSLDLSGTKLVVLSACETGMGDVGRREGVYGLRRAFTIAGAETLVTSLWKVDDDATRELMVDYYRGLSAGAGRSQALRDAQLAMRARDDRSHPYFWASFIAIGDWRTLSGADVTSAASHPPPPVPPGAGCGCREAPGRRTSSAWVLLVAIAGVCWARARRRTRGKVDAS